MSPSGTSTSTSTGRSSMPMSTCTTSIIRTNTISVLTAASPTAISIATRAWCTATRTIQTCITGTATSVQRLRCRILRFEVESRSSGAARLQPEGRAMNKNITVVLLLVLAAGCSSKPQDGARARRGAGQEAREVAARECRRLAQERLDGRARLVDFGDNCGKIEENKGIARQITTCLNKARKVKPCPPA